MTLLLILADEKTNVGNQRGIFIIMIGLIISKVGLLSSVSVKTDVHNLHSARARKQKEGDSLVLFYTCVFGIEI